MTNLYSVTYNTNNSTGGTTPATQTAESDATTYTFTAPTAEQHGLVKTGYTFMGWADSPTAVFQQYAPGATITLSNTDSSKTLYAIWGKEYTYKYSAGEGGGSLPANGTIMLGNLPYTMTPTGSYASVYRQGYAPSGWNDVTFTAENPNPTTTPLWTTNITANNINTMQDMSSSICSSLSDSKQLFDTRDGISYSVKKLSDGKCWMTQNLRIVNKAITPADSDVTSNYTIPASSTSGWSTSDANNNSVYYNNNTTYGAYYTWYAATAGTGNSSITTGGQNASSSICPKGWRLPTSKAGGEFEALVNKGKSSWTTNDGVNGYWFGGTSSAASGVAFFPAGGLVRNGSLQLAGSQGMYWSSTAYSAWYAYSLYFDSSSFNPSSYSDRYYGFSIRCVAR